VLNGTVRVLQSSQETQHGVCPTGFRKTSVMELTAKHRNSDKTSQEVEPEFRSTQVSTQGGETRG
jgi:hypothetical protein